MYKRISLGISVQEFYLSVPIYLYDDDIRTEQMPQKIEWIIMLFIDSIIAPVINPQILRRSYHHTIDDFKFVCLFRLFRYIGKCLVLFLQKALSIKVTVGFTFFGWQSKRYEFFQQGIILLHCKEFRQCLWTLMTQSIEI